MVSRLQLEVFCLALTCLDESSKDHVGDDTMRLDVVTQTSNRHIRPSYRCLYLLGLRFGEFFVVLGNTISKCGVTVQQENFFKPGSKRWLLKGFFLSTWVKGVQLTSLKGPERVPSVGRFSGREFLRNSSRPSLVLKNWFQPKWKWMLGPCTGGRGLSGDHSLICCATSPGPRQLQLIQRLDYRARPKSIAVVETKQHVHSTSSF